MMKREDFVAREELLAWVDQSFGDFTVGKPRQVVEQIKEIIWQAAQRETEAKTAHIADLERQLAEAKAAVPEGFAIIPLEPNSEIRKAMHHAYWGTPHLPFHDGSPALWNAAYKAMLTAAQVQPIAVAEQTKQQEPK
jgi:hypothetical protein